jgi:hypothetical protein
VNDPIISDHLNKIKPQVPPVEAVSTTPSNTNSDGEVKNEIAAGVALLSLNSVSEPHYLGGSSGYSWAKVLLGTMHQPPTTLFKPKETFHPRYHISTPAGRPSLPQREAATAMVDSFYMHVQARYAFMNWRELRDWLARQDEMVVAKDEYKLGTPEARSKGTASFFVW